VLDYSDYSIRHGRQLRQYQQAKAQQQQQQQQWRLAMLVGPHTVVLPYEGLQFDQGVAGTAESPHRSMLFRSDQDRDMSSGVSSRCGRAAHHSGSTLQAARRPALVPAAGKAMLGSSSSSISNSSSRMSHPGLLQEAHQASWFASVVAMLRGLVARLRSRSTGPISITDAPYHQQQAQHHRQHVVASRRLQQVTLTSPTPPPYFFCSKEVPFPYGNVTAFTSVDWLRAGIITPARFQGNCSNSFAFVTAALVEAAMALQGYNGTVQEISESHLMECYPHASCTKGGTVHVLLNYLACNGFAAVGNSMGNSFGAYPRVRTGTAADFSGKCATGQYHPVETGINAWSFVPATEADLQRAVSRVPAKVSVDASLLQTYRAGFIGCNALSSVANHAMIAVGYNFQAFPQPAPPGTPPQQLNFTRGAAYWMLKNSWGTQGSVDGFVYLARSCAKAAPLGLMLNRGVIPLWNQTEAFRVGKLQCEQDPQVNGQCLDNKALLLQLASFCAGVPDFLPLRERTNCSCSCIPS
jgi:hypothetical protein